MSAERIERLRARRSQALARALTLEATARRYWAAVREVQSEIDSELGEGVDDVFDIEGAQ